MLICTIIKQRKLTQDKAAQLMEIDQPKVSKIVRGLLSEFTIERLMRHLVALGCDIEIKPKLNRAIIPSIHVASPKNFARACL
jgi:predicted XRE-type DNA-binding protein